MIFSIRSSVFLNLFILHSTEGESLEKGLDPQTGSAVKFEEGMGTTEGDASAAPEGTGDEQEGL